MLKVKHECVVSPNVVPGNGESKYKCKVTCKACQWEALAINPEQAAYWVRVHEGRHANEV